MAGRSGIGRGQAGYRETTMKRSVAARWLRMTGAVLAGGLLLSACAENDPVRQRNLAELERLEACGWYPRAYDPYYPQDLQDAEARSRRGECGPKQPQAQPTPGTP